MYFKITLLSLTISDFKQLTDKKNWPIVHHDRGSFNLMNSIFFIIEAKNYDFIKDK